MPCAPWSPTGQYHLYLPGRLRLAVRVADLLLGIWSVSTSPVGPSISRAWTTLPAFSTRNSTTPGLSIVTFFGSIFISVSRTSMIMEGGPFGVFGFWPMHPASTVVTASAPRLAAALSRFMRAPPALGLLDSSGSSSVSVWLRLITHHLSACSGA